MSLTCCQKTEKEISLIYQWKYSGWFFLRRGVWRCWMPRKKCVPLRSLIGAPIRHPVMLNINRSRTLQSQNKGIHPENYREVFMDMSNEDYFISRSTVQTKETIDILRYLSTWRWEISNTSHPFYTGKATLVDTAGRVDKFRSRYG